MNNHLIVNISFALSQTILNGSISTLTHSLPWHGMAWPNVPSAFLYVNGCKTKQNTDRKNSNDEIIIIIESKVNQLQTMMTDRSNILIWTMQDVLSFAPHCLVWSAKNNTLEHVFPSSKRAHHPMLCCHTWECSFVLPKVKECSQWFGLIGRVWFVTPLRFISRRVVNKWKLQALVGMETHKKCTHIQIEFVRFEH